jgi:hypothetical protein
VPLRDGPSTAFLFHTVAECAGDRWRKALAIAGTRVAFFSNARPHGFRPISLMAGAFQHLTFKISLVVPP